MLKRLIALKEHTMKDDITVGMLYDIIGGWFLDDNGDRRRSDRVVFEDAPNEPLPHADIRKAAADGWRIELFKTNGEWGSANTPQFFEGREYRITPPPKTSKQIRIEEIEIEIDILLAESLELKND